jgi:hypothetical protein
MVGKLNALEDVLKKREADIKAIRDANAEANLRAAKAAEEAQIRYTSEIAQVMRILYNIPFLFFLIGILQRLLTLYVQEKLRARLAKMRCARSIFTSMITITMPALEAAPDAGGVFVLPLTRALHVCPAAADYVNPYIRQTLISSKH